jgi:hypothetical protein
VRARDLGPLDVCGGFILVLVQNLLRDPQELRRGRCVQPKGPLRALNITFLLSARSG